MNWRTLKFLLRDLSAQLRTKPALALGSQIQKSPPYFINLEPTCFCNLHCTICSYDDSRKKGYISRETVTETLKQAKELGVTEIRFFLAGEPLFHPHLSEFIAEAKQLNLITMIHSNATFMPQDRILKVLEAGLDKISFSFDGESAPEYEAVRLGASFDDTLDNIFRFLQIKKQRGGKFPLVTIQVIKLPSSPAPDCITPEFKNRFENLPIDEFLLLKPFLWPDQSPQDYNTPPGKRYFPCWIPWTSLSVGWEGNVLWCCGDLNGKGILGSINETTLKEIWNGPRIRELRKGLYRRDLSNLPLCAGCEAVFHHHNPLFSDLRDYYHQVKKAFKKY